MEKRTLKRALAALCAVCVLPFSGCAEKKAETTFLAMDTVMSVSVYGENAREAADACRAEAERLEKLLSVTDGNSEIYAVNNAGGAPVSVSAETAELLEKALELCQRTAGALDVTVYPLVRAWGFTTGEYRVPDESELAALLENVDHSRVSVENGEVTLPAGMELDLGAVAKGYTADRLAEILSGMGVESALLNLGHNIHLIGSKPDGSDWVIAVQSPDGGGYAGTLAVSACAVVTSGGYERFFTDENGETHHHIIDPATGQSAASGIISATIVGKSGLVCDALSTAVYVMGAEKAVSLWRESSDFEMLLIGADGGITVTAGIAEAFTPTDTDADITVVTR